MAQRTGAERFLASPAKSASAGAALALALAALSLCGCGGGSSDSEAQSPQASSSAPVGSEAGAGGEAKASPDQGGSSAASKADSKGSGAPGDTPGSSAQDAGDKQGPRIAQPEGPPEQGPTPAELASATVADMSLQSPAIVASEGNPGSLSPTYTCDGKDSWPALSWSGAPAGTAELALYVMNVQPVEGKLFVDWAVAGLDPGLSGIEAGELPEGAIVGTNGFGKRGYSICPAGRGEIYMFAIYALPRRLGLRPGFDAREARAQILDVSGNVGLLPALYAHG